MFHHFSVWWSNVVYIKDGCCRDLRSWGVFDVFDSSNPGVRKASVKTFGTKQNFGDGTGAWHSADWRSGKLTGDLLEESQRANAVSTSDIGDAGAEGNMLDFMSWDGMIHICASFLLSQGFFMEDVNCSFYICSKKTDPYKFVSINFHSSSAEVRQWSKHSSNSCWSKLVEGHDTFAIDGDIAKKRWDHCTEMRSEVLSRWSQFFQSWRKKKAQNATEKSTMKLLRVGGRHSCACFWRVGFVCYFTSTPLPFNSRIREPYQNLHVFREVFPKRKPYIPKNYKHTLHI